MSIKKVINWCKGNYQTLLAIGALLAIISFGFDIIKNVGITINIPLYFRYFHSLSYDIKIYSLAILNFLFTIILFLIITRKSKPKKASKKKK